MGPKAVQIIMLFNIKSGIMAIAALAATTLSASAKQVMTMTNGKEIDVEIITMGTTEISYKLVSNPNGPTYSTARSNVFFILFDDGTKEIITQQTGDLTKSESSQPNAGTSLVSVIQEIASSQEPKNYFPKIDFYPRASVGFQGTFSGYEDSYDLEWGGLNWSVDLNVLFPSSTSSAWTVGLGFTGLSGDLRMIYVRGNAHYNDKIGDLSAVYLTIPIGYYYKIGDWFTFGLGDRLEFLISERANGQKTEDTFRIFRDAMFVETIATIGKFEIGAQFLVNTLSAFKGEGLDWSPTLGINLIAGIRF